MNVSVSNVALNEVDADWLIVGIFESAELSGALADLDTSLGGRLVRLRESGDIAGKPAELLALHDLPGLTARRLLLVGLGSAEALTSAVFEKAMMTAVRHVSAKPDRQIAIALPENLTDSLTMEQAVETIAVAVEVGSVGQDLYRAEPAHFRLKSAEILVGVNVDADAANTAAEKGSVLGEAVNLTRDLVNRPAAEIYPNSFAERAEHLAEELGIRCEVLDEGRIRSESMNALLAVAAGSDQPPRVVVLEYHAAGEDAPTLALCGKGVTFDSGGLSLKTSQGMTTMKCDMAGAATVLGAMVAIARLNLNVNVVAYMGLVENMVSGRSYKLGDVLIARNGVTIEVLNTDAEGRLVLADVLSLAVDRGVDKIVDLATLTGACVVALGEDVTGVFTNRQEWGDQVLAAAANCGENAWQMPMFDQFSEMIKSDVADIKNIGGRWGGAITAAKFLERFVGDKPWVHLDIAGPSVASSNKPHREGGGTGCMVRTLVELARNFAQV